MKLKDKITAKIPEQKREKVKKTLNVLRVIKNVVCWTLIIILSFAVITFLLTRFTGGTPSLFGYTLQRVSSGSMVPELEVGDVILSRNLREGDALNEGDIITFDLKMGGDAKYAVVFSENDSVSFDPPEYTESGTIKGAITGDELDWGVVFLDENGDVLEVLDLG